MTRCASVAFALLLCLVFRSSLLAQSHALPPPVGGITVEQVIRLSQSGISDDVIVAQIKKRSQAFDLSPDQLIQLKDAHVSDWVIQAMTGVSSFSPDGQGRSRPCLGNLATKPGAAGRPGSIPWHSHFRQQESD